MVPGYKDSDYLSRRKVAAGTSPSIGQSSITTPPPSSPSSSSSAASEAATHSLSLGLLRSITLKPGNVLPLRLLPTSTLINSLSLTPEGPMKLVRSAGSFAQIIAHDEEGKWVQVRLQSGEVRRFLGGCCAVVGRVSNGDWKNWSLGKAGRGRWLGRRPRVRGVAMNACVSISFSLSLSPSPFLFSLSFHLPPH